MTLERLTAVMSYIMLRANTHVWIMLYDLNLFLLAKQLMLHSTSKFWDVYGRMCEGSDLISGRTTHGCSPWQCASPCCPPD